MNPNLLISGIIICFLSWSTPSQAQTVTVSSGDEHGHGFLVRQGATCYVILPKHVAAGRRSVTIFSAAPVVHSSALIETPFWDGIDLAVGVVRGAVEKRCVRGLSDLDVSARPESGGHFQLLRLRRSGEPERINMLVTNSQYLTLEAEIADGKSELFKGTSGAFLFEGETPMGMVVEALSPTKGKFIRIEEIFQNVRRRLERRSGFAAAPAQPAKSVSTDEGQGLPFELVSSALAPIDPDLSESNLRGPGSYVFQLSRPNRLAFKAKGKAAIALSKIQLRSEQNSEFGIPRNVQIELSNTENGLRTRMLSSVEMAPDGVLNIQLQQVTRWVFITIRSGWDGTQIGLDSVVFK